MNNLAGVASISDDPLVPRVKIEPLEPARVSEVRGAIVGPERLRELMDYDPGTGHFTHKPGQKWRRAGKVAGAINNLGYRLIRVDNRLYRAHRLAWLYVHGEWPAGEIDHINGKRDDNRIENLRDVTVSVNQQNRKRAAANGSTGLLGVSTAKARYRAAIALDGASFYLGSFDTAEEAHEAYLAAKRKMHAGCTL